MGHIIQHKYLISAYEQLALSQNSKKISFKEKKKKEHKWDITGNGNFARQFQPVTYHRTFPMQKA